MNLETQLAEAINDFYNSLIDPTEPYWDAGENWSPVVQEMHRWSPGSGILDEAALRDLRNQCRTLAATNEFAINGHENRISYLVGTGHTYRAAVRKGCGATAALCLEVQRVIDDFVRTNRWHRRQQEIVRRLDRDGEVFLRFFTTADGGTLVRFVEPGQVAAPSDPTWTRLSEPRLPVSERLAYVTFGILTDPHDVETVRGYFVDGQLIDAGEIQHRKANVDANVKRGLPLYYPVRKNLRRADKLLRNMSTVAEIQSAIALIRKHRHGTRIGLQEWITNQANNTTAPNGDTVHRYGPGTILDTHADIDYNFPASSLDAANYVAVLQAELRAIAARLVMPEFMFSSDASNSNFASTLVAEGPAVRMFARLQAELMADDLAVMWRVVETAIRAGRLASEVRELVEIQIGAPSLPVRDQLKEAEAFRIEHEAGILSPQTWSQRRGLDYDQEQENWEVHRCKE
jgi:capsid protein